MAKNKNRERKQPQSERGQQAAQQSSMESQAEHRTSQVTPGDMARKGKQKRFGHN
ncbi:hypothetical protein GCM10022403_026110 [Streptomyces coacervatus]|uniref:Small hydrophilic protein n=1 Tax=Streptomyces coacervatus TaxID=647381 RepID=A0ABP7HJY8_9ACTN|nr:hypothetical protein [Streptomyces coacervatus]MDF2265645.1 hypothetical protein [Streptomyces coacervatus]